MMNGTKSKKHRCFSSNRALLFSFLVIIISSRSVYSLPDYLHPKDRPYIISDKYCGAYAIWHTLHHYGLTKPIDIIVKEMQIKKNDACNMYQIVEELKANGISARAVELDLNKISTIDRPFIQYIRSKKDEKLGHFTFCIPTGSGKAVVVDGTKKPRIFKLDHLEEDYSREEKVWDGASILIDGNTRNAVYSRLVSLTMLLSVGVLVLVFFSIWLRRKYRSRRPLNEGGVPME